MPVVVAAVSARTAAAAVVSLWCLGLGASTPARPSSEAATYRLRVAVSGLAQPTYLAAATGDRSRLYVVERRGTVRIVRNGRVQAGFFLDIRRSVSTGGERGLLSLAFHPGYPSSPLVYVFFTQRDGTIVIEELRVAGGRAEASSARVLVSVPHDSSSYHNGGQLAFGPDGALYAAVGDGGYLGQTPDPNGNSQNMEVLPGKLIRIRVDAPDATPEIVAYGLRNAWRFSFAPGGDLVIGDVGYKSYEEVDVVPAGTTELLNYGWSPYEGRFQRRTDVQLNPAGRLVWPVHSYSTNVRGNCAITGGYVYRGSVATLRSRYVFGDFCSGRIWSGRLTSSRLVDVRTEPVRVPQLASFGLDAAGELYVLSLKGTVHRFWRR